MAAGLGFKTFNTGEVLTSADVNGYLMQGVLVFASEAARNAAITSPQEGQFAYTKDNNSLWYYTGSAWAASGATGDVTEVQAGTGISVASGTGPIPVVTNSMATAIDAKGDLIVGTGADTFSRLAVGTNGQVLTADSNEATGLKFATPAGGGKVLQVINDYTTTNVTNSTNAFVDTGLEIAITPSSASSKVLILITADCSKSDGNLNNAIIFRLFRGATRINNSQDVFYTGTTLTFGGSYAMTYLDSPATTSATTYKLQFANINNSAAVRFVPNNTDNFGTMICMEIGA